MLQNFFRMTKCFSSADCATPESSWVEPLSPHFHLISTVPKKIAIPLLALGITDSDPRLEKRVGIGSHGIPTGSQLIPGNQRGRGIAPEQRTPVY